MGETPGGDFCILLGWAIVLALGFSALGFVAPASGQAAVSQGEEQLSGKFLTDEVVIDLCKWEPMSCPRCEIEPWYCNGHECPFEPGHCIKMVPVNIEKAGS